MINVRHVRNSEPLLDVSSTLGLLYYIDWLLKRTDFRFKWPFRIYLCVVPWLKKEDKSRPYLISLMGTVSERPAPSSFRSIPNQTHLKWKSKLSPQDCMKESYRHVSLRMKLNSAGQNWLSKLEESSEVTPKSFPHQVVCLVSVPIQHSLELLSQSMKVHIMIYNITLYIKHKLCHNKTIRYFSLSQCLQRLYVHVSWVVCRKHKEKSRHDLELRSVLWSNLFTECSGRQDARTQLGNESAGATSLSQATVN